MDGVGKLYVEGKDDKWTLVSLLARHGIDMDKRPVDIRSVDRDKPGCAGIEALLRFMPDAIRNSYDAPVAFVMDVDIEVRDRWSSVRARLVEAGLEPPESCPEDGYVGRLPEYPHDVGVWLMPNCRQDHGTLEDLIASLVPLKRAELWEHAQSATRIAREVGSRVGDRDLRKAELHCWLAWQEVPGLAFGTAINARFLGHDSPAALQLVAWVRRVFEMC